jgi:hypothetical protein
MAKPSNIMVLGSGTAAVIPSSAEAEERGVIIMRMLRSMAFFIFSKA